MHVLLLAALGVFIVLCGILLLRLHPFLALLLGSFVVLIATPRGIWLKHELTGEAREVIEVNETGDEFRFDSIPKGGPFVLWRQEQAEPSRPAFAIHNVEGNENQKDWMAIGELGSNEEFDRQPFAFRVGDRVIDCKLVDKADRNRIGTVAQRLSSGLSGTFQKIGLPIAMAAIIGMCLLESGAASRLVMALSQFFGIQRTAPTLMVSGFLLGVPVYFDTVFYLLLPLAKAFGKQRPGSYLLAIMAIIVGATMAHSLVPPTPGPLLVAAELGVSIGVMMLGGIVVGGTAALSGYAYGIWCNRSMTIELPIEVAKVSSTIPSDSSCNDPLKTSATLRPLPLWLASLPLAIPIVCLGGIEIWKAASTEQSTPRSSVLAGWIDLIGDPGFVLMIAALIAFGILRTVVKSDQSASMMTRAIADAGTILMLTCAGGAFGAALKQLQIADAVAQLFPNAMTPFGILWISFILTGMIRIAQGSATVAMITTVGIISPLVQSQSLPFHTVYVALAIGCGSKLLPWMNDSGFWQVSTMTGMSTTQTLKTFSVALSIMGCIGFFLTLLGAWLLPFKA